MTASAQEAEGKGATRSSAAIQEIVVTARKREENLQEVPTRHHGLRLQRHRGAGHHQPHRRCRTDPGPVVLQCLRREPAGSGDPRHRANGHLRPEQCRRFRGRRIHRRPRGPELQPARHRAHRGRKGPAECAVRSKRVQRRHQLRHQAAERGIRGQDRRRDWQPRQVEGQASVSGPILGEKLRGRIAALYDDWDGSYDNSQAPQQRYRRSAASGASRAHCSGCRPTRGKSISATTTPMTISTSRPTSRCRPTARTAPATGRRPCGTRTSAARSRISRASPA